MGNKTAIIKRIDGLCSTKVFIVDDFVDIAESVTVERLLNDLVDDNYIVCIEDGLYYKRNYIEVINEYAEATAEEIAKAIARKNHWHIGPSGNSALNILGLSTQVPIKNVFVTDSGDETKVLPAGITIVFKHTNTNTSALTWNEIAVLEALKSIGERSLTDYEIDMMRELLKGSCCNELLQNCKCEDEWIKSSLKKICEDKCSNATHDLSD